jgi:hypothetical protein
MPEEKVVSDFNEEPPGLKERLLEEIPKQFRCVGGGTKRADSFIADALSKQPLAFSSGVSVEKVIDFIFEEFVAEMTSAVEVKL